MMPQSCEWVSDISGASKVRAEKSDVPTVGTEKDVERVTSDRNGADRTFDNNVQKHARQQETRHAKFFCTIKQVQRKCRRGGIPDDRP